MGFYETKDGKYVSIAALEPWFYANLCELLGREDLLPYEWDAAKWDELSAEFRKIFRTKTRDEWIVATAAKGRLRGPGKFC